MPGFFNKHKKNKSINNPQKSREVDVSDYSIWQLVGELRNLATAINYMYAEYDVMAEDTIIGAALQIYADNAIQIDSDTNRILKIDSDDHRLIKDLEAVLNRLDVEDRLWNVAYNTAKYGNKYWKILVTSDGRDIDSIEEVDSPTSVMDLHLQGDPAIFAYNDDDREISKTLDYKFYDRNSFVHFMIQSGKISDRIELRDYRIKDEVTGEPALVKYQIKRGESMIEGVRAIYRILKTLEDNLIASVIARGEYTKIVNIEGSDNNEVENRKLVNKVKRLFDSRMSFDTRDGHQSAETYRQPRGFMDPIFNVTANGKGTLTINSDGGEIEVGQLTHIDYFNKLKFSGLRITPSMLAFEENIPGGLSGSADTMIQQDIRLAMHVRKLTTAITSGIEDLLNIWLTLRGRENEIGKFHIRMAVPSTAESLAELNELNTRLQSISNLSEIITKNAPGVNTAAVTKILFDEYIPNRSLLDKINKLIKEPISIANKEAEVAKEEIESALRQLKNDDIDITDMDRDANNSENDIKINHPNLNNDNSVESTSKTDLNSNKGSVNSDFKKSFKFSDTNSQSYSDKFII